MAGKSRYEMDLAEGSIVSKMLIFTLPLMCSSLLQLLFNAADIVVVGRYAGDNALAAVGSNTALINLMTNLFVGLSVAVNVLVARYFGAGKEEDVEETVHSAVFLSLVSGLLLTIVGIVGARQILIWMQTPAGVLPLATTYLRIYFLGMTPMMFYNFGSAILRAVGDTKRPLYYLMIAGVINVILNMLFVIKFHMGVSGVAWATTISQIISAVLVLWCLIKEEGMIQLKLKSIRLVPDKFKRILQIGIPAGVQGIVFSLSNVVIQSSVNLFGETVVAGNSAAANIEGFVYVAMNSFHQSALAFTGQNIGAGKKNRVIPITIAALAMVTITGLVTGNLAVLFGKPLLSIYTGSPEVIEAGLSRLRVISATYALCGIMDVMVGIFRGLGYSIFPMVVSMLGACGLRLLLIGTVFRLPVYHNVHMLYYTYPISWIVTILVYIVFYAIVGKKDGIFKAYRFR